MKTCSNCRFFHGLIEGEQPDHCRRNPPVVINNGQGSTFAVVKPEWKACGEHKPAPRKPKSA